MRTDKEVSWTLKREDPLRPVARWPQKGKREWSRELPRALAGSDCRLLPTHEDRECCAGTGLAAEVRPNGFGFDRLWLEIPSSSLISHSALRIF